MCSYFGCVCVSEFLVTFTSFSYVMLQKVTHISIIIFMYMQKYLICHGIFYDEVFEIAMHSKHLKVDHVTMM